MTDIVYARHVRRPELGFGKITETYSGGTCKAVFGTSVFTGIPESVLKVFTAEERSQIEQEERARAEEQARAEAEREIQENKERLQRYAQQLQGYGYQVRQRNTMPQPRGKDDISNSLTIRDTDQQQSVKTGRAQPVNASWWYQAFKQHESDDSSRSMETRVVGVTYENRQDVIASMEENEDILLVREPENPFDLNAISVTRRNGRQIGYIPRELAACLAERFDAYGHPISAVVTAILGREYIDANLGVRIRFSVPRMDENNQSPATKADFAMQPDLF